VVPVHATFADEGSNWVTLAPLLANAGYCVYAFNYGETILSGLLGSIDGLNYITQSAEELKTFVNKVLSQTKSTQVDLVGHSQGGMMPNYYLKYLGGASKVNTFIGLAPSNHGTTLDGLK
jgi:triacylglycerol esterase/lipase EstA (alpha/beta hydrolase family)